MKRAYENHGVAAACTSVTRKLFTNTYKSHPVHLSSETVSRMHDLAEFRWTHNNTILRAVDTLIMACIVIICLCKHMMHPWVYDASFRPDHYIHGAPKAAKQSGECLQVMYGTATSTDDLLLAVTVADRSGLMVVGYTCFGQ